MLHVIEGGRAPAPTKPQIDIVTAILVGFVLWSFVWPLVLVWGR